MLNVISAIFHLYNPLFSIILIYSIVFLFLVGIYTLTFKIQTRSKHHKSSITFRSPIFYVPFILSLLAFFAGILFTFQVYNTSYSALKKRSTNSISLLAQNIENSLSAYQNASSTLSGSPHIKQYIADSSPENLNRAVSTLRRYCRTTTASVCYLMDNTGTVVATSNITSKKSFQGKNYSYRPYYTSAKKGNPSTYVALGATSDTLGFYSSHPVLNSKGIMKGVVVIKKNIKELRRLLIPYNHIFVTSKQGIIILSSKSEYQLQTIAPAAFSKEEKKLLQQKFSTNSFSSLFEKPIQGKREINFQNKHFIPVSIPISNVDMKVTSIIPLKELLRQNIYITALFVGIVFCIIAGGIIFMLYREQSRLRENLLSEKRFQQIFEGAPEAIFIVETNTKAVTAMNKRAQILSGIAAENNQNPAIYEFLPALCVINRNMEEQVLHSRHGDTIPVSVSSADLHYENTDYRIFFVKDITEIKKIRNNLETSVQKYRQLMDDLPETIFETDADGYISFLNKRGKNILGITKDNLRTGTLHITSFVLPEERPALKKAMSNLKTKKEQRHWNEFTFISNTKASFPAALLTAPILSQQKLIGFRGIIIDLTEHDKNEKRRKRTENLENLGFLAGGIAHDMNNILAIMEAGVDFLRIDIPTEEELRDSLSDMHEAVTRGKKITNQLLTFSKGGDPVKENASVSELTEETARFLLSGSGLSLTTDFQRNIWNAHIDPGQMGSVIQNIILNAKQAMGSSGLIHISAHNIPQSGEKPPQLEADENYIKIAISDTGPGIPPDTVKHIFDPFFTTKETGTGLGLSIVFSIMKKHGGLIDMETEQGNGTTFYLYLPAAENNTEKNNNAVPTETDYSSTSKIILVDDEASILKLTEKILTRLGYIVHTAQSTEALFSYMKEENGNYDAAILDLTIPGDISGAEAGKKIKSNWPHVKIIVSSGYSNNPVMAHYKEYGFETSLVKPYTKEELQQAIAEALD